MRITLDLDYDIYVAIAARARIEGRSPGNVLSELARQALAMPSGEPDSFFGFTPFRGSGRPVTSADIDRIRDGLDI
jgi:hypothetical protein